MRRLASLVLLVTTGAIACGGSEPTAPVDAGVDAAPPTPLANLVTIDEIAAYQTVKVSFVSGGAAVAKYNAPILTAKPGVFRVFYKLDPKKKFRARTIEAELHLLAGTEKVLKESKTMVFSSTEDSYPSTFNFPFDAKTIGTQTQYYVVFHDPALAANGAEVSDVRFPAEGMLPLTVSSNPGGLNVVIVPIQYGFDTSNRLPETGQNQLDTMKSYLVDMYPVETATITVRSTPLVWNQEVQAGGKGWGELLNAIVDLRAQDAPPRDTYYVGAFQPKGTFGDYCGFGCVLGLAANVTGAFDIAERAVISIGYPGGQYNETVAHELGHVHGRYHSPCGGAQGTDPKYPYDGGGTGVAGYQLSQSALVPADSYDVMGYCQPVWISDYTYKALFDRVSVVNGAAMTGVLPTSRWERILIGADGTVSARATMVREEPGGEIRDVVVTGSDGTKRTVHGHWVPFDHVGGGFLWLESATAPSTGKMTRIAL